MAVYLGAKMGLLDCFLKRNKQRNSASIARERLQILVAHEGGRRNASFLPKMKEELIAVIRKYVEVQDSDITVNLEQNGKDEILEVNIVLPDDT